MLKPVSIPKETKNGFSPLSKHVLPDVEDTDPTFNVPHQVIRYEDALEVVLTEEDDEDGLPGVDIAPELTSFAFDSPLSYATALKTSPNDQEVDDALRHIEGFSNSRVLVEAVSLGFGTPKHACWCVVL